VIVSATRGVVAEGKRQGRGGGSCTFYISGCRKNVEKIFCWKIFAAENSKYWAKIPILWKFGDKI